MQLLEAAQLLVRGARGAVLRADARRRKRRSVGDERRLERRDVISQHLDDAISLVELHLAQHLPREVEELGRLGRRRLAAQHQVRRARGGVAPRHRRRPRRRLEPAGVRAEQPREGHVRVARRAQLREHLAEQRQRRQRRRRQPAAATVRGGAAAVRGRRRVEQRQPDVDIDDAGGGQLVAEDRRGGAARALLDLDREGGGARLEIAEPQRRDGGERLGQVVRRLRRLELGRLPHERREAVGVQRRAHRVEARLLRAPLRLAEGAVGREHDRRAVRVVEQPGAQQV